MTEIRPRKRPYPREVTDRHANGKPMLTRWEASNDLKDAKMVSAFLRAIFRDPELSAAARARAYVEGAKAFLKHYQIADIAKATGLSRAVLYTLLKPKTQPTFDTVWRIYRAFGLELAIGPVSKKKTI